MKRNHNLKVVAMMASCALIANAANLASVESARAQGLPDDAQQIVQTMRPMYTEPSPQRVSEGAHGGASMSCDGSVAH